MITLDREERPRKGRRDLVMRVRVGRAEKWAIRVAAARRGETVSAWVRRVALAAARAEALEAAGEAGAHQLAAAVEPRCVKCGSLRSEHDKRHRFVSDVLALPLDGGRDE